MAHKIQKYGWRPDLPDHRDFKYAAPQRILAALPQNVDLRPKMPPVFDQGNLGSCTANAAGGMCWYDELKEGRPSVEPSRLFIYYTTRVSEGTVNTDSGASIREAVKAIANNGFPPEHDWPYDISKFTDKPPQQAYNDAKKEQAISYHSVAQNLAQIQAALAQGNPVDFGFTVFSSFESEAVAKTGIVPMPHHGQQVLGGHSVLIVGYDNAKQWFIVRNSWGTSWGDKGYCYMPYAYILNPQLASDFWVINAVP